MPEENRLNEDFLAAGRDYAAVMEDTVLPYLKARQRDITVTGAGGASLFCSVYTSDAPENGTVLVAHGFTECGYKFSELIYSLLNNGFSAVAYDHRGHGRSWRDEGVKSDFSLTHVTRFQEYVDDMQAVVDQALEGMPRPWSALAHSMGGAILGLYLEQHPGVFARAVLCAPMIAPNRSGMPLFTAKTVCRGAKLLGMGKKRLFISKPYAGPENFDTSCATSKERFQWFDAIKAKNPLYHNNGPTYGWTLESLNVTKKLLAPGAPERIDCPVTLYTAEIDNSVLPHEQELFIRRVKQGTHRFVKGAKHEIFRSTDDVLFPWWHEVLGFLKER